MIVIQISNFQKQTSLWVILCILHAENKIVIIYFILFSENNVKYELMEKTGLPGEKFEISTTVQGYKNVIMINFLA